VRASSRAVAPTAAYTRTGPLLSGRRRFVPPAGTGPRPLPTLRATPLCDRLKRDLVVETVLGRWDTPPIHPSKGQLKPRAVLKAFQNLAPPPRDPYYRAWPVPSV